MSVLDRNVIDFGHEDDDKVTLCISDHIPWDDEVIDAHLVILQEKINDYLDFISSGQIYEEFGGHGKIPNIKVIFCYEPVEKTVQFLEEVKEQINSNGYELEWLYRPIEE